MRTKFFLGILGLGFSGLVICNSSMAAPPPAPKPPPAVRSHPPKNKGAKNMSPTEKAQKFVDKMEKELGLNPDQKAKMLESTTRFFEKNEILKRDMEAAKAKHHQALRDNQQARYNELKQILSPEQMQKVEELKRKRTEQKGKVPVDDSEIIPEGK